MASRKRQLTIEHLRDHLLQAFFKELKDDRREVGLELEIFPFRDQGSVKNALVPLHGKDGVVTSLAAIESIDPKWSFQPTSDGVPRYAYADGGQITFEPGAQVEYSSTPHPTLVGAVESMTQVLDLINRVLAKRDIWLFHGGLNPWYRIDEVGLQMDKERYVHMNNFFNARGPFGQKMMRLSTSLQVNLDVGIGEIGHRRWLAANLMAPVMTAAFANSPFCEGKRTGAKSYRSLIWQSLDPTRTGFQRGLEAAEYEPCPVHQYLDFALDAFCMRLPDENGKRVFDGHFRTFRHWLECGFRGFYPDMDDWVDHLSTLFPEVRPRGFFEIRCLDALCAAYWMIPCVVFTHVLYDETACEEVISKLMPYRTTLTGMLREAAMRGLEDDEMANLARAVFAAARRAAEGREDPRLLHLFDQFDRELTSRGRCPADELLELNDGAVFTAAQYRDYERRRAERLNSTLAKVRN